jgi:transcription factor E2F4/5
MCSKELGSLRKKTKNAIQWKGASPGTNTEEFVARVERLKEEVRRLDFIEKDMDKHRLWLEQSLRNVTEEPSNIRYAYVREEDMCTSFVDQTIITIKTPKDVQIEIPQGDSQGGEVTKYKIHLKAAKEPIYGYLVNPELEAPGVIVEFPEHFKNWSEAKKAEKEKKPNVNEMETQEIEAELKPGSQGYKSPSSASGATPTRVTRSRGCMSPGRAEEPEKAETITPASIISTRRQAAKRLAGSELESAEEQSKKKIKTESTDLLEHSDLITVHDEVDLSTVVAEEEVSDFGATQNLEADEEDDLVSELPDGFCSTTLVGPILRLSPPPTEQDYRFTLAVHEGLVDLYDVKRSG